MHSRQLRAVYGWDSGLTRQTNEDSILCVHFDITTHAGSLSAGLFAVADGMGGHNAGEIASDIAVKCLAAYCIPALTSNTGRDPLSILAAAYRETNNAVLAHAGNDDFRGMGTTLTTAVIIGSDIFMGHIGDSRCYIINDREIIQITKDHSTVQLLVDEGIITREQAWNHPHKNEITRVIGLNDETEPDFHHLKLYSGDTILLCSDGLCGVLPTDIIAATIRNAPGLQEACDTLIQQANTSGGPDNISVIIVQPDNLPSWRAVIESQTFVRSINVECD